MDIEDNLPLRGNTPLELLVQEDLDPLSIAELETRISTLNNEIGRCEAKVKAASSHRSIADSFFKKG